MGRPKTIFSHGGQGCRIISVNNSGIWKDLKYKMVYENSNDKLSNATQNKIYWLIFSLFLIMIILALYFTSIHFDCAFYLDEAERILNGNILYVDMLEFNPPIAAYFSIPPVWIALYFNVSAAAIFISYVILIIILSLCICYKLINMIFHDRNERLYILFSLTFLILAWPLTSFGQREHVVIILTIPYILSAINRALDNQLDKTLSVMVGILAGIGLSFKPYFLCLWIFVECYLIILKHKKDSLLWIGNIAILFISVLYYLIVVFHTNYLSMVSLALQTYHGLNIPFLDILLDWRVAAWFLSLLIIIFMSFSQSDKIILRIIFIASTAFYLSVFLQHKGWPNHFYPGLVTSLFMLSIVLVRVIEQYKFLFLRSWKGVRLYVWVFITCLAIMTGIVSIRKYIMYEHSVLPELIPLVKTHAAGKPIFFFSTTLNPATILIPYSKAIHCYRLWSLWYLPTYYRYENHEGNKVKYHQLHEMDKIERMLFDVAIDDLIANPPMLLIVDQTKYLFCLGDIGFDFLEYFSMDVRFSNLLRQYSKLVKIGDYQLYKR